MPSFGQDDLIMIISLLSVSYNEVTIILCDDASCVCGTYLPNTKQPKFCLAGCQGLIGVPIADMNESAHWRVPPSSCWARVSP
jgi:hypothetical protein